MAAITGLIIASIIAGLAGTAAGVAGSVYGADKTKESVDSTNAANVGINQANNAFNAAEAQKQRDWEEQMSNTAIQRRVADLKAAGLNPMLAVTSGSASTPGAYAATSSGNAQMKAMDYVSPMAQVSANLGHLVNSANSIIRLQALTKNNPQLMGQLNKISSDICRSTTNAQKMSEMDELNSKYGDLIRNTNLWR